MRKKVIKQISELLPELRENVLPEGEMALVMLIMPAGDRETHEFVFNGSDFNLVRGLTTAALENPAFYKAMQAAISHIATGDDEIRVQMNESKEEGGK